MSSLTTVCASEFILLEHHPDLSRRPEARPGLVDAENRRAALTWTSWIHVARGHHRRWWRDRGRRDPERTGVRGSESAHAPAEGARREDGSEERRQELTFYL